MMDQGVTGLISKFQSFFFVARRISCLSSKPNKPLLLEDEQSFIIINFVVKNSFQGLDKGN